MLDKTAGLREERQNLCMFHSAKEGDLRADSPHLRQGPAAFQQFFISSHDHVDVWAFFQQELERHQGEIGGLDIGEPTHRENRAAVIRLDAEKGITGAIRVVDNLVRVGSKPNQRLGHEVRNADDPEGKLEHLLVAIPVLSQHALTMGVVSMEMDKQWDAEISCMSCDMRPVFTELGEDGIDVVMAEETGDGVVDGGLAEFMAGDAAMIEKLGQKLPQFHPDRMPAVEVANRPAMVLVVRIPVIQTDLFALQQLNMSADEILENLVVIHANDAKFTHRPKSKKQSGGGKVMSQYDKPFTGGGDREVDALCAQP